MPDKVQITADFPTPKDVASHLRIAPARAAELRQQLIDLHGTAGVPAERRRHSIGSRNGAAARAKKK